MAASKSEMSPTLQKTRSRILRAAREILENTRLDLMNMQDVAKEAGIGRATLYRQYQTKEHLVNHITLAWGEEFASRIEDDTVSGKTVGECLITVIKLLLEETQAHPNLIKALLASLFSADNNLADSKEGIGGLLPMLFEPVLGGLEIDRYDEIQFTIQHLLLGNLFTISSGNLPLTQSLAMLRFGLERLLGKETWNLSIEVTNK